MNQVDLIEVLQQSPSFVNDHFAWYDAHERNPEALYGNLMTEVIFAKTLTLPQLIDYVADSMAPVDLSKDLVITQLNLKP